MARRSKISQTPLNPEKPRHRGVVFIEGVPTTTKSAFKAECAEREETMRDAIIKLMRWYVKGGLR